MYIGISLGSGSKLGCRNWVLNIGYCENFGPLMNGTKGRGIINLLGVLSFKDESSKKY